jgi:peptidoglycan/xylan/chitin deacetylase (PgdA/CDA1 family)
VNLSYRIGSVIFPEYTWRKSANSQEVYLTFDDGPHPEISTWVLEQLKRHKARASFFMVGENAKKYPHLVKEVLEAGHSIGNHTQRHLRGWTHSSEEYVTDILACENYLPKTTLFRPPYGQMNFRSGRVLTKYEVIMWDVLSMDFKSGLDCGKQLLKMKKSTSPGSIIVFHDSQKARENLYQLLPDYLQFLDEQGLVSMAL